MAEVNIPALFSGQIRVSGISVGSGADQEDMIRAIETNRLQPVIDSSYGLDEITAAFEYYQTQSHFGKVVREIGLHRPRAGLPAAEPRALLQWARAAEKRARCAWSEEALFSARRRATLLGSFSDGPLLCADPVI